MSQHELIEDSIEVLRLIDEALEANDPYNNPDYSPDYSVTLQDCFFPDCIEDPLLLLRETIGEEQTSVLEYIGDLELIAETLRDCISTIRNQTDKKTEDSNAETLSLV